MSTILSDEAGLLDAIAEEPEADDLRLIYADWLHDHGDPERAEFIRLQFQIAAEPETSDVLPVLQLREREILSRRRHEWERPVYEAMGMLAPGEPGATGRVSCVFRRGLPDCIVCPLATWVHRGPRLATVSPVTSVTIVSGQVTTRLSMADGTSRWQVRRTPDTEPVLGDRLTTLYDTEKDAIDALGRACLLWARKRRCKACRGVGTVPRTLRGHDLQCPCPKCADDCASCNQVGWHFLAAGTSKQATGPIRCRCNHRGLP